ncbi:MAG: tRNA pseudouridine(13) synthase TruD [Gammaproteobacteria bacterium]|nr:MAG: tRNA pseudouridine(13) synthase TruD [Gammaproteobacteria bacterium]
MTCVLPDWPQPGEPLFRGRYRTTPEAFRVDELPGWAPSGAGEHLLLRVAKRGANTAWVAQALARRAGCQPSDVGYCGEKDRHAVTTQWFSLREPRQALQWSGDEVGDGWNVLALARHDRKLRRGDHAGNRFSLRLELEHAPAPEAVAQARARLEEGIPNYFGPQRFGRDGGNLARAAAWVDGARLPARGPERGRILSTARSLLFNEVVAARVRAGCISAVLDGDVVEDAANRQGAPTGPMWGRGRSATGGAAAALEAAALAPYQRWCERLEYAGLKQERRALVVRPGDAVLDAKGSSLQFECVLPPGVFVTSVLAALGTFFDGSGNGDGPGNGDGSGNGDGHDGQ